MRRRAWCLLLVLLAAVLVAAPLLARVGGGDSYSGGGSGGGGAAGEIGAELLFYLFRFLFWLTIHYPAIGIPLDIVVIVIVVRWVRKKNAATVVTIGSQATAGSGTGGGARQIGELRRFDPNFSEITFSDFCYSLYARAHHARGTKQLDQYAPYLSDAARATLQSLGRGGLTEVKGIVIGAFRIVTVAGLESSNVVVKVVFESNYTEAYERGDASWYAREQWTLERRRDILSPPPEKAKADHCPRCGAALQTRTDGSCEYCGVRVQSGAFNWYVRAIAPIEREARGPLLTSNVPERGTDRRTIFQQGFMARKTAFESAHPGFDWQAFDARVREIALELQNAWTAREWERVRPLETDSLFQTHRYWIDAYLRQNLRNIVDGYRVARIEVVKIDTDAFYESITVRLWAEGHDHTVDAAGNVVAGSKQQVRVWSEYWTFIRTIHGDRTGQPIACPNCGAAVPAGSTGVCPYCGGKLTTGTFDWVLSRIEQDEAYG